MENLAGSVFTLAGSAVLLFFGIIYLLRPRFMPYHEAAAQKKWSELAPEIRVLILALMRTVAGGFIAAAFVITLLQLEFNRSHSRWIALAILITGAILCGCILYATLLVRIKTKGRPPTLTAFVSFILLLAGYFLNILS